MRPVFVSYAREDAKLALRLAADLKSRNASVWLDQLDILPGQQWDLEVERALRDCKGLLVILTPASVASNNVMDEIGFAIDEGKLVIPVLAEQCEVPFRLRRRQYIDVRSDYESGLQTLAAAIASRSEPVGTAAAAAGPSPPPALALHPDRVLETPVRPGSAATQAGAAGDAGRGLLWTARILSIALAALTIFLFSISRTNIEMTIVEGAIFISLLQFLAWKWSVPALVLSVVFCVVTMVRVRTASDIGALILPMLVFLLPSVLLHRRARNQKKKSSPR